MRDLKFRVWSKTLKRFVPIWSTIETRRDDVLRPINYDFIIEQYTGIKDKNSVDVYEGDYIKAKSTIYKIEWFNTAFWAIPEIGYGSSQPISSLYEYEDGMAYKVKVIGNIHENPDLLVDDTEPPKKY